MITFPPQASLAELQKYMASVCRERGWDQTSELESFLLLMEEVGELAKAMRAARALLIEEGKPSGKDPKAELESEFADVLSYLLELANKFDIDLEEAFRKKERRNAQRNWKK
ncbi:MAG: RS21-C6 protein [Bacteroidetes bacterium]|nr:MAG: RS21-C6 protein [Bacteroidota bacterium]